VLHALRKIESGKSLADEIERLLQQSLMLAHAGIQPSRCQPKRLKDLDIGCARMSQRTSAFERQ
jgi:hypothetical protein